MELTAGQHVSHYRVLEQLGRGGMDVVYLAEKSVPRAQRGRPRPSAPPLECERRNFDRAVDAASRLVALSSRASIFLGLLGRVYAAAGRRSETLDIVTELDARRSREYVIPTPYVQIWATFDDRERTRASLMAAIEDGVTGSALEAFGAPLLAKLGRDPECRPLLDRLEVVRRPA